MRLRVVRLAFIDEPTGHFQLAVCFGENHRLAPVGRSVLGQERKHLQSEGFATTVPAQQSLLNRGAIEAWSRQAEWLGLTVLQHRPKVGKHHAQVEFEARFREQGESHSHHELSAFVQIEQRWYFIDPTVPLPGMKTPCFCGSGKKFKQCCGQFLRD